MRRFLNPTAQKHASPDAFNLFLTHYVNNVVFFKRFMFLFKPFP